ncbi:MAG: class I SAM-dependent methyltransferase [Rhizobiales bacterium]|nr:class I SAM-dependent methyltransferase [Hyphomicrobiales bacterium]
MAQRISNIYRLVTIPAIYSAVASALGGHSARIKFVEEDLKVAPGMRILDVGCGPAAMFPYLPPTDYTGVDLNPPHIAAAQKQYGDKGRFIAIDASSDLPGEADSYDLVFALAILHHLDDEPSKRLIANMLRLVKPGGRVVTFDSVWLPRQNPVAYLLNKLDSGLNIRTAEGYVGLAEGLDAQIETRIYRDRLRVPFDHFRMTLIKRPVNPNTVGV